VLGAVTIGNGAVVAAGAVVLGNVPPYALVAGNPAKVVRYRFSAETVEALQQLAWWDWPDEKILQNAEWLMRPVRDFLAHVAEAAVTRPQV
jgi:virginiamycin A acetyltransferase